MRLAFPLASQPSARGASQGRERSSSANDSHNKSVASKLPSRSTQRTHSVDAACAGSVVAKGSPPKFLAPFHRSRIVKLEIRVSVEFAGFRSTRKRRQARASWIRVALARAIPPYWPRLGAFSPVLPIPAKNHIFMAHTPPGFLYLPLRGKSTPARLAIRWNDASGSFRSTSTQHAENILRRRPRSNQGERRGVSTMPLHVLASVRPRCIYPEGVTYYSPGSRFAHPGYTGATWILP